MLRTVASLIVGLGGLAMMAWAVYALLQTGTCGTGGPYQITKPCPPGSGLTGWLLMGGFFAWFAGLFLSNNGLVKPGVGQLIWCGLFLGGGAALLLLALADNTPSDSNLAAYIMAAVFIPLGLAGAVLPFLAVRKERGNSSTSD